MTYGGKRDEQHSRTPEDIATRWQSKKAAYLNDLARYNLRCIINTLREYDKTRSTLLVIPEPIPVGSERIRGQEYSIGWYVRKERGSNPDLKKIASRVINIACTPATTTPYYGDGRHGPIRPYRDMLFYQGELELAIPENKQQLEISRHFEFGIVMGLAIVTPDQTHKVWTPKA